MQPDLKNDAAVVALQPEVSKLSAFASALVIKTQEEYAAAADQLKAVKGMLKQIADAHARVKRPLLDATRELDRQKNEASAPLLDAERQIKRAMVAYDDELERKRRAEQARLEEAARKEREKLAAQAAKAAAAGKIEKAAELEMRAETVVAPVVQREAPKVAGIATREVWRFEVTDPNAVPREYLTVDEKKLGAIVRALKGDTNIPGVRVWAEKSLAAGAA